MMRRASSHCRTNPKSLAYATKYIAELETEDVEAGNPGITVTCPLCKLVQTLAGFRRIHRVLGGGHQAIRVAEQQVL